MLLFERVDSVAFGFSRKIDPPSHFRLKAEATEWNQRR
jgi:hypothetical protein